MSGNEHIEDKIWNYIDGNASAEEISFVEELLQKDAAWKAKYAELLDVHLLMKNDTGLEEPSLRFTQNVMEEISRLYITPAASSYINKNVIRGIGIFFMTMIVGLLVYGFGQIDWSAPGDSPIGTFDVSNINWSNINWSNIFNSTYVNVFIMVNIVLGLMLLDMYLTKKKRAVIP